MFILFLFLFCFVFVKKTLQPRDGQVILFCFVLFYFILFLFIKNFGASTKYKIKTKINIVSNSRAITGHKNAANVT